MGICNKKPEEEDIETGLTRTDTRLLRKTWHYYCVDNHDYAAVIFLSFFIKSRGALELFRRFRDKPLGKLPQDPQFRAHAIAVSFQLTSMVDTADDAVLLEALIRKNARAHTERHGVMPDHFRMLGKTVVEVLHTRNERRMTPLAIRAWEKLFDYMARITKQVYEEEKVQIKSVDIDGFTRELDADIKEGATGSRASNSGTPQSRGKRSPKASQPAAKSSRGTPKGGQSRAAATPKGSQSSAAASPKAHQSSAAATPKGGQSSTAATPRGGQSRAAATPKRGQSSAAATPKGGQSSAAATPKRAQSLAAATSKGGQSSAAATPKRTQSSAAATPKECQSPDRVHADKSPANSPQRPTTPKKAA